jgi:hypothetical protein
VGQTTHAARGVPPRFLNPKAPGPVKASPVEVKDVRKEWGLEGSKLDNPSPGSSSTASASTAKP